MSREEQERLAEALYEFDRGLHEPHWDRCREELRDAWREQALRFYTICLRVGIRPARLEIAPSPEDQP